MRDKGSAGNGVGNRREEIKTVLAGSREIASDTSKRDSAIHSAKASGYFLTHFYHAYVLLCLIIRKRDTHVMQKGKNKGLVLIETYQEVLSFGLFGSATFWF